MQGVYHQCKEIERVLAPHYRVRLTLHEYMFPHTDPADDRALYILMTPHLCVDLPPHYIIWQTEQWGHYMLQVGNRRWANQRNKPDLLDYVEVFEVKFSSRCILQSQHRLLEHVGACMNMMCCRVLLRFGTTALCT